MICYDVSWNLKFSCGPLPSFAPSQSNEAAAKLERQEAGGHEKAGASSPGKARAEIGPEACSCSQVPWQHFVPDVIVLTRTSTMPT